MAKKIVILVLALLLFSVSVFSVSADNVQPYAWTDDNGSVFYLENVGETMIIPNSMVDTGNFMRFWDYDGTKRYDFIGPSDKKLQSASFAFNKWGVYTTLCPQHHINIIKKNAKISLTVKSWFFKQMQENVVNLRDNLKVTLNGRVWNNSQGALYNSNLVSGNNFVIGYGEFISLPADSFTLQNDTVQFNFVCPDNVDSLYITFEWLDRYTISQAFGYMQYPTWQNKPNVTPSWQIEVIDRILTEAEQEKQDAENAAGESIDSVQGSIDSGDTGGVTNAIKKLIAPMTYSGRDAFWTFPEIKIPQIDDIVPEMVLSEEKKIDLLQFRDGIPDKLLLVIRALADISIVLFCFRELYGMYEYVLTLRKGG